VQVSKWSCLVRQLVPPPCGGTRLGVLTHPPAGQTPRKGEGGHIIRDPMMSLGDHLTCQEPNASTAPATWRSRPWQNTEASPTPCRYRVPNTPTDGQVCESDAGGWRVRDVPDSRAFSLSPRAKP
jgi:hypothetical protein